MSNPLARPLCRLTGHDPDKAEQLNSLQWYATLGFLMLLISALASTSTYVTMHTTMNLSSRVSLVAAAVTGLFVFGLDRMLCLTVRAGDRVRDRLGTLALRGFVSLVLSLFIAHGIIVFANHDDLNAMVTASAAAKANSDRRAFLNNSPLNNQIAKLQAQQSQLRSANTKLAATAQSKHDTWWSDMVVCSHGKFHARGKTCGGDTPGWGDISRPLYRDWKSYVAMVQKPQTVKNNTRVGVLSTQIDTLTKTRNNGGDKVAGADMSDVGLAAQTRALITLLKANPFLWILPLVLLVLDMSIAFAVSLFPRPRLAIDELRERELDDELYLERKSDPNWVTAKQRVNAELAAAFEKERITALRATPSRERKLVPVVATLAVIALVAGVLYSTRDHGSSTAHVAAHPRTSQVAAEDASKGTTVNVSPDRAVTVQVPGVGTLAAAKGSFSRAGTMTVTAQKASPPVRSGVVALKSGIDATFTGTTLIKPATLTYTGVHRPAGAVKPVIAHRSESGRWNYLPATLHGSTVVVRTQKFSVNVLGWIGDRLASALGGRTSPLNCSGAPDWFSVDQGHSDLVHVCSKDAGPDRNGVDRAEIQIKSNRGVSLEVTVPGTPQYVWEEGQTFSLRQASLQSMLGIDPNKTVILPAGTTMTIGYVRTAYSQNLQLVVSGSTGLAMLDTLLRWILDNAIGLADSTFIGYTIAKCSFGLSAGTLTTSSSLSPQTLSQFAGCMLGQVTGALSDPNEALKFAIATGGSKVDADALAAYASKLNEIGLAATVVLPVLQSTAGNLWDNVKGWATDARANEVTYSIQGTDAPHGPAPVITVPNGGLQGGNVTGGQLQGGGDGGGGSNGGGSNGGGSNGGGSNGGGSNGGGSNGGGSNGGGSTTTPPPQVGPHTFYDNYGSATRGIPMCRGNAGRPESMPGGTAIETFRSDASGAITTAKVQIDPDATVTAHATLSVNGNVQAQNDQSASGDVTFTFGAVHVNAGDTVALSISFTATYGKIITVYEAGSPANSSFTVSNTCSDGAPSFTTGTGLRATLTGTS